MATGDELKAALHEIVDRNYTFMHICGTHEAAIARSGLRSVLPENLHIVMGPGCPVCITPQGEIDAALEFVEKGCIVATYGDLLRVPGTKGSLESCGGDVRVVQGIHKAVEIAEKTDKEVVFISVGFETTVPTVAATILSHPPENFSILSCHRLVPPAMQWLLEQGEASLDGFLLPGHVCVVAGYEEYEQFPVPQVVAGFEPEDILLGLLMLVKQVKEGRHEVENAYPRAVCREGNTKAKALISEVFDTVDVEWRGFPVIPKSGLCLKDKFSQYDARKKFDIEIKHVEKVSGCICDRVLRGIAQPTDCKLFGKVCTPRTPVGPCMVSHEGACKIWNLYHVRHL
ncbi:MAG: hydrogenase formation protein HypD [Methanofollis sp.]|jgi:hydrogenase expression/formation protein HypD|uniref:hydrogenase formation protein HypD n=1 Tax=unclassified Methanofollis TaxID=2634179 RepID=UPI002603B574|nr:hydrogenase formation protein HypD [Methanofollis sp.]MDD4255997.1 hydrogenase formation protein HypD [Methanofollis sp.]